VISAIFAGVLLWCYAGAMSGKNFEGISGKLSLEKLLFKKKSIISESPFSKKKNCENTGIGTKG
jgi:hypothetical protein